MRHEVKTFAQAMEHKLKKNDHKGGWENLSYEELFALLRKEVDELEQALANEPELNIIFEAADIANFAMMIGWNALRSLVSVPTETQIAQSAKAISINPDYHDPMINPHCPGGDHCDCIPF